MDEFFDFRHCYARGSHSRILSRSSQFDLISPSFPSSTALALLSLHAPLSVRMDRKTEINALSLGSHAQRGLNEGERSTRTKTFARLSHGELDSRLSDQTKGFFWTQFMCQLILVYKYWFVDSYQFGDQCI